MENLMEMYEGLSTLMKVFWGCAAVGSAFMVVQLVMSLIGIGDAGDLDVDMDVPDALDASTGMDLFTVKNITNFVVGFGWGGVSFGSVMNEGWLLVLVAVLCGVSFVALFIFIFRQLMKIQGNSAVGVEACVGQKAEVYLRIPASRQGKGKIQLSIHGAAREFNAITDDASSISTGAWVKVIDCVGDDTLIVTTQM